MAARKAGERKTSGTKAGKSKSTSQPRSRSRAESKRASAPAGSPRPTWSGNLRLALVSVPILVYPATKSGARISFHQIHEPTGKRIRYQKVVPGLGPVDTDEIVKGFELEKGEYVLLDPEEIDELKLETKKTLDVVQFVRQGEIDPIWFDRPYYVVADGELAEEAYAVIRDALRTSEKLGLGQFVMRGREYVAAIKPCGSGLLLETLRFADEVRGAAPFFADVDEAKADEELLELASELIERKTAPFKPDRFEDQYTVALRELIESKAKGKKLVGVEGEDRPERGGNVVDLVDALKKSVKSSGGSRSGKGSSGKGSGTRRKAS